MRVAIVKASEQHQFSNVRSLRDLKQFAAGQGKTWTDTFILESNGLTVEKTLKYDNLFPMLEGDRFDYFPRGIHEPWREIVRFKDLNLTVDPHIIIRYVAPLYFFIRKDNHQLKQTLDEQFEALIEDGTFAQLFFSDSDVRNALSRANTKQRIIIDLDNPLLTPETPIHRKELWFDPLSGS